MTTQPFDGYYVFEADQVLTNDHLNQEFYYLDWQERLTRNKLIGTGIVCGLDITSTGGKISISKGSGVTSEGYLIVLESAVTYDFFVQYTGLPQPADLPFTPDLPTGYKLPFYSDYCAAPNPPVYQLLDSTKYSTQNPMPAGSAALTTLTLSNYAVALFVEINEKDLKNCDTQDCNNKGEKMAITIQALLVQTSALPTPFTTAKPNEIKLARYNVPYLPINNTVDVLTDFYNILNNGVLTNVAAGYAWCYDRYSGYLSDTQNPFSNPGFSLAQQLSTALTNLWNNTSRFTIQYLYDYINDLILAYQEFRETAASALLTQCVGHELDFPLHVILGEADSSTTDATADPYRTYFIYSPIFDAQNQGMDRTQFLFNRMKMLTTTLNIQTYTGTTDIKITPSQYMNFPLSERCIPFYYNPGDVNGVTINQVWNYFKTLNDCDDTILGYNSSTYSSDDSVVSPLLYDIEKYNFFRVEGHIGQPYSDVLSYILNQQLTYNLPFDVVAISADLLTNTNNTNIPECSITDLESEFRLLVTEFLSKLFLCIYKFATQPYNNTNLTATTGTFSFININLVDIPDNDFIADFNLEFNTYAYGDFLTKYTPFTGIAINTVGSAYVQSIQQGAVSTGGFYTNPISIALGMNDSYVLAYNLQFQFLNLVDSMFYQMLNSTLSTFNSATFVSTYEKFNVLLNRFETMAQQEQLTLFSGCGCECLVTIVESILVLLAEYQARFNNYLAQLSFLNYYKSHPGLEHKAGVPKGGTLVLVYHTETTTTTNTGFNINKIPVETDLPTEVKAANDISIEKIPTVADIPAVADIPKVSIDTNTYTIDQDTLQLVRQFVDECNDAPPTLKQTIIGKLPPFHIGNFPQFPSINDGAVIADFYIPYQCCSDCAPIAYMLDNKLNVYTVSGGGSACANAAAGNTAITAVSLSGSDLDITYNLYNSSDPSFKTTMTGTGSPLNFGTVTEGGTYTVVAVSPDGNTKVNMNGSAVVTLNQPPTPFNVKTANNATSYCIGTAGVDIFLDGSQSGVQYQLFNGATADPAGPVSGTGSMIDFGIKPNGTYTVVAKNTTTGCTNNMTGGATITVNQLPGAFNVTPPGTTHYTADVQGVVVGLDQSGPATINYQLLKNGVIVQGAVVPGTGQAVNFGKQTAGTYTVTATDTTTGCSQAMTGSAIIVEDATVELKYNNICAGSQSEATGSPAGGTYSSSLPNIATVDPQGGFIAGLTAGTTQISYTVNGVTGSQALTVNPLPAQFNVTPGGTTDYTAAEQGVVIGLDGSGPDTINYQLLKDGNVVAGAVVPGKNGPAITFGTQQTGTYTVIATDTTGGCVQAMKGSAIVAGEVTLILKPVSLCAGKMEQAMGQPVGGVYSSDKPDIAKVDPNTGAITAVAQGTAQISYTLNSATASQALTVNPLPVITINGKVPTTPVSIIPDGNVTAVANIAGGQWATSDNTKGFIKAAGQSVEIVGGQAVGAFTITYTSAAGCIGVLNMMNTGTPLKPIAPGPPGITG